MLQPMMRLDVYLRNCGLIKQRSQAKRACEAGDIRVDGQAVSASHSVRPGVRICMELYDLTMEVEVLALPQRPPPRRERAHYYRLIRRQTRDPDADLEF